MITYLLGLLGLRVQTAYDSGYDYARTIIAGGDPREIQSLYDRYGALDYSEFDEGVMDALTQRYEGTQ